MKRADLSVMGVGTSIDVCSAFLVTFFTPYILNGPQIKAGARTAFIWMALSVIAFIYFFFFLPELKGRSLEEVDELFEKRLWAWQFAKAETTGIGARIRQVEEGHDFDTKGRDEPNEPKGAATL